MINLSQLPILFLPKFLLWFGWFGFNGGSALAANGIAETAFANTDIAGSISMITWLLISWKYEKRPSLVGDLTGAVAGLATITPFAGFVRPFDAVIIGFLAACVCYTAVRIQKKFEWDDTLAVWECHGVGGILGSILVGIIAGYTAILTVVILRVINKFIPIRVNEDQEYLGLDETLHGEAAYRF